MKINQITSLASRHAELKSKCYQLSKEQTAQAFNILHACSLMLQQLKTKLEGTALADDTLLISFSEKSLYRHVDELKTILKCHQLNMQSQTSLFNDSDDQ